MRPWVKLIWENITPMQRSNRKKGSFWWRDLLKLLPNKYEEMAQVNIRNGKTCMLLWKDSRSNQVIESGSLELLSYV